MRGRWEEKFGQISALWESPTSYGYIRTSLAWLFPMMTIVKRKRRWPTFKRPPLSHFLSLLIHTNSPYSNKRIFHDLYVHTWGTSISSHHTRVSSRVVAIATSSTFLVCNEPWRVFSSPPFFICSPPCVTTSLLFNVVRNLRTFSLHTFLRLASSRII